MQETKLHRVDSTSHLLFYPTNLILGRGMKMNLFALKIGWVAIDVFIILAITIPVEWVIGLIDKKFENREVK